MKRMLIIEAALFFLIVTSALYGGEKTANEDSSPESKQIKEKIDRGLGLALEAITIAGNNTMAEEANSNDLSDDSADQSESEGYSSGKENSHSRDQTAENTYRKSFKVSNPLITEPIKILKEKHSKKPQSLIPKHYTIKIPANRPWTRTGVYLKETDIVRIFCKGKVMPGGFEMVYKNSTCLAEGYHFTRDNFTVLPNVNYMAAIGKIGNRDAFYIGSGKEFVSYMNGPLYLGINDLSKSIYTGEPINKRSIYWKDNTGGFVANVYVYRK